MEGEMQSTALSAINRVGRRGGEEEWPRNGGGKNKMKWKENVPKLPSRGKGEGEECIQQ
jgi:hypothetical protein